MKEKVNNKTGFFKRKSTWIFILVLVLVAGAVYMLASWKPIPYRVITDYPVSMVMEEAQYMHECAECHKSESFHTCDTCHSEHGSADMANLSFYSVLHVTGDVPEEKYFPIYQMFSKRYEESNKVGVLDLLEDMDVTEFESVTFCTNDGGFSTITKENLGETSYLLPYEEGVRFADKAIHVSAWLKGIDKIIVVSGEDNLVVNGQGYSFGELLIGDTVQFTVEQAPVMYKNKELGTTRTGTTATRLEGVELGNLAAFETEDNIQITLKDGSQISITGAEASGAKLAFIGSDINLVFPGSSRSEWINAVEKIEVE
jgi:hypothetical protein